MVLPEVAWSRYNASSSGSACKSRRERVSRIKVIDPAHLTEARITGHTMIRIVCTGLFSATHAGLSAAHYLEMPDCHSSLLYTRALAFAPACVTLRYARPRMSSRETSFHTASAGLIELEAHHSEERQTYLERRIPEYLNLSIVKRTTLLPRSNFPIVFRNLMSPVNSFHHYFMCILAYAILLIY